MVPVQGTPGEGGRDNRLRALTFRPQGKRESKTTDYEPIPSARKEGGSDKRSRALVAVKG